MGGYRWLKFLLCLLVVTALTRVKDSWQAQR